MNIGEFDTSCARNGQPQTVVTYFVLPPQTPAAKHGVRQLPCPLNRETTMVAVDSKQVTLEYTLRHPSSGA